MAMTVLLVRFMLSPPGGPGNAMAWPVFLFRRAGARRPRYRHQAERQIDELFQTER
jgi:hypothetical protein